MCTRIDIRGLCREFNKGLKTRYSAGLFMTGIGFSAEMKSTNLFVSSLSTFINSRTDNARTLIVLHDDDEHTYNFCFACRFTACLCVVTIMTINRICSSVAYKKVSQHRAPRHFQSHRTEPRCRTECTICVANSSVYTSRPAFGIFPDITSIKTANRISLCY